MNRLKHITFTGIDEKTDIKDLCEIQKEFKFAEFGVLTSYHWNENGNRYLNPDLIHKLRGRRLNLSLHVCGSAAHDAAIGKWDKIDNLIDDGLDIFKRVQINIANRNDNPQFCWIPIVIGQELIIQQSGVNDLSIYDATVDHWTKRPYPHRDIISVLIDASGGRGIDTPMDGIPVRNKVGYAGGINPDNVGDKLSFLLEHYYLTDFWIDMESGVRTDDWFDIDKVEKVLLMAREIISGTNKNKRYVL
jgi:hypothetical protein